MLPQNFPFVFGIYHKENLFTKVYESISVFFFILFWGQIDPQGQHERYETLQRSAALA